MHAAPFPTSDPLGESFPPPPVQAFRDGLHVSANLFADFEDWQMGTFGWSMHGAPDTREADYSSHAHGVGEAAPPRGAHFDPRNFSSLGPRVSVEVRYYLASPGA